jgi:hypothetical protein
MELFIANSFYGLFAFLLGISILNMCSFIDRKSHHDMKKSRMLMWYGRRKMDSLATLPFDIRSGLMTIIGSSLSLYGLILILASLPW